MISERVKSSFQIGKEEDSKYVFPAEREWMDKEGEIL
jgi:hypothetical protein